MKWNVLKDLYALYVYGKIKKKKSFLNDPDITHLINSTREICVLSKEIIIPENSSFRQTYEKLYLDNFLRYKDFLQGNQLEKPQIRFEDEDIRQLIEIKDQMDSGSLSLLRQQILKANETVRGVSFMFFKNEKYLDEKDSLVDAIQKILQVPELPSGKDKQYLYVIPCKTARAILLCENLYFLRVPEPVRKYNIELWFAGGYNIGMLDDVDTRNLPIYYSCDWDYDGLTIFDRVKSKIPQIQLLYPNATPKSIVNTEHKSLWKKSDLPDSLSELNVSLFNNQEKELIRKLITDNEWIIEEGNDIGEMIRVII